MTESTDIRFRLGPFPKAKVIELPLEAMKVGMIKVFWQDLFRDRERIQDLQCQTIFRPPDYTGALHFQNFVQQ